MKKTFKIIQIIILALAGLGIYNMMTTHGLDSVGRYQYRDFPEGNIIRFFVDFILLISLLVLIIRKWTEKTMSLIHFIVSDCFIILILIDMSIWLGMIGYSPAYYSLLITYTLSLIIVIRDIISTLNIKSNKLIIAGGLVVILGFLSDIIFINIPYQDAPSEIADKAIMYGQFNRLVYYIGFLIVLIGIINKIIGRVNLRTPETK